MSRALRVLLALVVSVCLAVPAGAQTTTPAGAGFRAETEPDMLGRRGAAIVGWLYNDGNFAVSNVRVRVDVLDAAGQAVGSGEAWVYGNVPAQGRAYFVVPVSRYGERYRVSVLRYDRTEMQ